MAKPLSLVWRGLRLDFPTLVLATKLAASLGGIVFFLAWAGLVERVPAWLQIYVGASVAFTFAFFVTRRFVPPAPLIADKLCPRCTASLHYCGFECPRCGVLAFGNDRTADDVAA